MLSPVNHRVRLRRRPWVQLLRRTQCALAREERLHDRRDADGQRHPDRSRDQHRRRSHVLDRGAHGRPRADERRAVREPTRSSRSGAWPTTDVGLVSGNPPGLVSSTDTCGSRGLAQPSPSRSRTVNDPTPTSYATAANYKKVIVDGDARPDDGRCCTRRHFVAPPSRAPYGGINNAIINANIVDLGDEPAYSGRHGDALERAEPDRSDTTDVDRNRVVRRADAQPDERRTGVLRPHGRRAGLRDAADGRSAGNGDAPATSSHIQLAPSQTSDTSIQIFKPATINAVLQSGGSPYTGGAALKMPSSFTGATTTITVRPARARRRSRCSAR